MSLRQEPGTVWNVFLNFDEALTGAVKISREASAFIKSTLASRANIHILSDHALADIQAALAAAGLSPEEINRLTIFDQTTPDTRTEGEKAAYQKVVVEKGGRDASFKEKGDAVSRTADLARKKAELTPAPLTLVYDVNEKQCDEISDAIKRRSDTSSLKVPAAQVNWEALPEAMKKAEAKKEKELASPLYEFLENQVKYHRDIQIFCEIFLQIMNKLKEDGIITQKTAEQLAYLFKPYQALAENPFQNPQEMKHASIDLIGSIHQTICLNGQEQMSPQFKKTFEATQKTIFNHADFSSLLDAIQKALPKKAEITDYLTPGTLEAQAKKKFPDAPSASEAEQEKILAERAKWISGYTLAAEVIKPIQNAPRYRLTLEAAFKACPRALFSQENALLERSLNLVNAEVLLSNTELTKYQDLGKCALIVVAPGPGPTKLESALALLPEKVNAAYIRVKAPAVQAGGAFSKEMYSLIYVNKATMEFRLITKSPKKLEAFDKSMKILAHRPKSKGGTPSPESLTRTLSQADCQTITKRTGHVHSWSENTVSQEVERRTQQHSGQVLSGAGLGKLIEAISKRALEAKGEQNRAYFRSFLKDLRETAKDSALTDEQRMSAVRKQLVQPYVFFYAQEKGQLGPNLRFLNRLCTEHNLMELQRATQSVTGSMKEKVESRILRGLPLSTEDNSLATVRSLFKNAMAQGLGERQRTLYVNARKAVNHMGPLAVNTWNALVLKHFDPNKQTLALKLIIPQGKIESRKEIAAGYAALTGKKGLVKTVHQKFYAETLQNVVRDQYYEVKSLTQSFASQNRQKRNLFSLFRALGQPDLKRSEVYVAFMKSYLDAYIHGRDKKVGGTIKDDALLQLEQVAQIFTQKTQDPLFRGPHQDSSHATLLSSVERFEKIPRVRKELVNAAFQAVMTEVFSKTNPGYHSEHSQKMTYVNAVKAVIRMGEGAVAEWNQLAHAGKFPELVIQSIHRDERQIDKHYVDTLAKSAWLSQAPSGKTAKTPEHATFFSESGHHQADFAALAREKQTLLALLKKYGQMELSGKIEALPANNGQGLDIYKLVLQEYSDLYLREREKSLFGSHKGPNLENLEKALKQFHGQTQNNVFGGKNASSDSIFGSCAAAQKTCHELVDHLFNKALQDLMRDGLPHNLQRKAFVNAVKAVIRMGKDATEHWNAQVAKMPPEACASDCVIKANSRSEEDIGHLCDSLMKNEGFIHYQNTKQATVVEKGEHKEEKGVEQEMERRPSPSR